jgi:hypothetical protein
MKLPRTSRATSVPPNISLTSASIRLTHATTTICLRPRRRQPVRDTSPELSRDRLGSPFAFHPARSRAGTPSTVTSITESIPVGEKRAYWLRSSRESEWDCRVNQLQSPADLRVLIHHVQQLGDPVLLGRCHTILVDSLCRFIGDFSGREALQNMDFGLLIQQADGFGFWNAAVLQGIPENQIAVDG